MRITALVLLAAGWLGVESSQRVGTVSAYITDPRGVDQAAPSPTAVLPDLLVGWYCDHWWNDCI